MNAALEGGEWSAARPGRTLPIVQKAGWAPGPLWTGVKSHPHRDSIPDPPARSSVAIPTELPGPTTIQHKPTKCIFSKLIFQFLISMSVFNLDTIQGMVW